MVRLWEHMRARVTKGEGHGIESEGEEPPPLVGESEVLYRTVYSFGVLHSKGLGPYGSCVKMKPVRAE